VVAALLQYELVQPKRIDLIIDEQDSRHSSNAPVPSCFSATTMPPGGLPACAAR
jgi:hypothetical protein